MKVECVERGLGRDECAQNTLYKILKEVIKINQLHCTKLHQLRFAHLLLRQYDLAGQFSILKISNCTNWTTVNQNVLTSNQGCD